MSEQSKTEIVAFCSGKGGTGKSLMCACFGYALLRGGHRVLMIDGDPATDGLSLFLLGPKGQEQIPSFGEQNTFIGALDHFHKTGSAQFEPRAIHRRGDDHGVTYEAIISGKGLYGEGILNMPAVPDLNQEIFRAGIRHLFDQLRVSEYDYVLVDTRGGFAFESTDLCALADSFIVITEPDYTSFYQDRNLVSRIAAAARDLESPSLLRAMIVNKAVDVLPHKEGTPYLDTLEVPFRNELVKEFPVRFQDTHPVPVSIEALLAYKAQKIPYKSAPDSMFCMATLAAFTDILGIVTSRWTVGQVDQWNALVDEVTQAVQRRHKLEAQKEQERQDHEEEFRQLRVNAAKDKARMAAIERESAGSLETMKQQYELKVLSLQRELEQRNLQYEREFARSEALTSTTIALAGGTTASYPGVPPPTGTRSFLPASPASVDDSLVAQASPAAASSPLFTRRNLQVVLLLVVSGAILILAFYLVLRLTSRRVVPETTTMGGTAGSQLAEEGTLASGPNPSNDLSASTPVLGMTSQKSASGMNAIGKAVPPLTNEGARANGRDSLTDPKSSTPGLSTTSQATALDTTAMDGKAASSMANPSSAASGTGAPPGVIVAAGGPAITPTAIKNTSDPMSGRDAARLHTQAAHESDQAGMVTLLCKAAELVPNNGQYAKDCDISKIALLGSDKQMLKNARDAGDAGKVEAAKRFAMNVSPLSPDLYREAQLLLTKLNTTNPSQKGK